MIVVGGEKNLRANLFDSRARSCATVRQLVSGRDLENSSQSSPISGIYDESTCIPAHQNGPCATLENVPPRGFEPLCADSQAIVNSSVTQNTEKHLPENLPLLAQTGPDLAAVLTAWPELPEVVKARIVGLVEGAMVKAAVTRPTDGER